MARLESKALAGYYPYPSHLLPITASLVTVRGDSLTICDPCAGDGAALEGLLTVWNPVIEKNRHARRVNPYTAELEQTRADALRSIMVRYAYQQAIHGDAFRIDAQRGHKGGCDLLWLNPPYDVLPNNDRLERLWLERFTDVLRPGSGVLLFVIPRQALAACADYLARQYESISWVRLPDSDYAAYQQLVVIATRADLPIPESTPIMPLDVTREPPILGSTGPLALVNGEQNRGLVTWALTPSDQRAIVAHGRLAVQSGKVDAPSTTLGLDLSVSRLLHPPTQPVLLPPRPGHIAQALAMGLFNGVALRPDATLAHLPTILLKGIFTRERVAVKEKTNKKGEAIGVVEVERPQLRLTALDLDTGALHRIQSGTEATGATDVQHMNAADLLACYGDSLADALRHACPPIHQPGVDPESPLPPANRRPFPGQAPAISAALKSLILLRENPPILGEVGVGKTTIALLIAASLAPTHAPQIAAWAGQRLPFRPVRTALVMCPTHLLSTWQDEVQAVLPEARVVPILTRADLDTLRIPYDGLTVALLSKETAKLGYGWAPVGRVCPDCGQPHRQTLADLVSSRARCAASRLVARNPIGRLVRDLAILLVPTRKVVPHHDLLPVRMRLHRSEQPWERISAKPAYLRLIAELRAEIAATAPSPSLVPVLRSLCQLITSIVDPDIRSGQILATLDLYAFQNSKGLDGHLGDLRGLIRMLALCMPDDAGRRLALARLVPYAPLEQGTYSSYGSYTSSHVNQVADMTRALLNGQPIRPYPHPQPYPMRHCQETIAVRWDGGYGSAECLIGQLGGASLALSELTRHASFQRERVCGASLVQAVPSPRRLALAPIIARRYRDVIDLLILDEAHEYANDGSAQQQAAHQLAEMKLPTLWMSGSISDGFASGLFMNLWAFSRSFRQVWGRDSVAGFTRRYGYRKHYREFDTDGNETDWRARQFGAVSDRVLNAGVSRALGESPGVLPHALLTHILPTAVLLHKRDLEIDLPPKVETPVPIALDPTHPLALAERNLRTKIVEQIGRDRFEKDRAGRLFGALGQVPFFLDRSTTDMGNGHGDVWNACYPESLGSGVVAQVPLLDASAWLPKETWLRQTVAAELAEGRNVIIGVLNTGKGMGLIERLTRLLSELTPVRVLDSDKVSASKRKDWIAREVVAKQCRVLLVNPTAIQTGLNNLVHCSTLILYQTPPGHAKLYRQVIGRIHRPGQTQPVRVFVPYYEHSTQEIAVNHLGQKVSASLQVDGLDIRSALDAAGAGIADALDVLSLGEHIYATLTSTPMRRAA